MVFGPIFFIDFCFRVLFCRKEWLSSPGMIVAMKLEKPPVDAGSLQMKLLEGGTTVAQITHVSIFVWARDENSLAGNYIKVQAFKLQK